MKDWLTTNQIYFTTLGAVLPSLIAVFVSLVSLFQANRAVEISTQQAEIARNVERPYITAELRPVLDSGMLATSHVELVNHGELVRELQMDEAGFISVECSIVGRGVSTVHLPIHRFFAFSYLTGQPSQVIGQFVPGPNFQAFQELARTTILESRGSVAPRVWAVVRLNYQTKFGAAETVYFAVDPYGTSRPMSPTDAERLIQQHRNAVSENVAMEFAEVTSQRLLAACK